MTRPVRITPLAEADIQSARDGYEAREQGLGNRFVLQVRATLDRIAASPFQYQIVSGTRDARRARVHDCPFDVAGTFIYNGITSLHDLEFLD